MFLIKKSDPDKSDQFWLSPVRNGSTFVTFTFAWPIILAGLLSITLIQRSLWWVTALLWGSLLVFTMIFQVCYLWYVYALSPWHRKQKNRAVKIQEQARPLREDESRNMQQELFLLRTSQAATAFERSFQTMGIQTEDYHQEIEEALSTLYGHDADQQRFFLCLHRLLQVAKQNWTGLAAFSPREREILELLLQDISYKEMSSRLHVSISTVKTHVYHIFQKLDISNREEAISIIRERGWFFQS